MAHSAFSLHELGVTFGLADRSVVAFRDVSLEAEAGQFIVLIGPSGCGKSTLLRTLGDLLPASLGLVSVFGTEPRSARMERKISFVFQDATLLPWRTVLQNVQLPLQVGGWRKTGRPNRSPEDMIALVGLSGRENAYPRELSGGQRQRVSIARALVTNPDILLMDEPFGALDEITRDRLNEELLRIWREIGTTIVFVTHGLSEAAFLGEKVVVMSANPGRIMQVVDLTERKPGNRLDRSSAEFFEIASELRTILHRAYGEA
ncbi:NitT/TauT family transport system ATP-binding protein [Neorhizobium galegae]|uniref:ABC transporter ATP-binding protein n=1 Tax=Neorhizobium galegae TaxID=399 RepID=UPI00278ACC7B|nr:ABC transporter ATP-binding protein [Neorhizobium galegae]MDQ0133820.1 NitT/TauT family transport system ATP-binding protein [Neorhizobium galegae]